MDGSLLLTFAVAFLLGWIIEYGLDLLFWRRRERQMAHALKDTKAELKRLYSISVAWRKRAETRNSSMVQLREANNIVTTQLLVANDVSLEKEDELRLLRVQLSETRNELNKKTKQLNKMEKILQSAKKQIEVMRLQSAENTLTRPRQDEPTTYDISAEYRTLNSGSLGNEERLVVEARRRQEKQRGA